MTPSDELLLALLRRDWDCDARPAWHAGDADWTRIVQTALDHGVAGLVCRSVGRMKGSGEIPEEIARAAAVHSARAEEAGLARLADLYDVVDALCAEGIAALTFKGPALGVLAHASATIRPSRDIDVLVHRSEMARAVAALRCLDYCPSAHFSPRVMEAYYETYGQTILHCDGRTPVEPHWMFAPKALAVDLDMEGVWDRAAPLTLGERSVLSLSTEDTLLTACVHGTKEKWWRLLWVADIAALVHRQPALNWDALEARAEEAGVSRMLRLGLCLAADLFATTLPHPLVVAIERDPTCRWLRQQSKAYLFDSNAGVGSVNRFSSYHLRARERMSDRARYVFRLATTPGENHFKMVDLPDSLVRCYVAVKLVHDYLLLPAWQLGKRARPRRVPRAGSKA